MATLKNILSPAGLGLGASKNIQACTRCGELSIKAGLFDLFDAYGTYAADGRGDVCSVEISWIRLFSNTTWVSIFRPSTR